MAPGIHRLESRGYLEAAQLTKSLNVVVSQPRWNLVQPTPDASFFLDKL